MLTAEGYSGTPLIRKLGFKPGLRLYVENAPPHYRALLGAQAEQMEWITEPASDTPLIHAFFNDLQHCRSRLPALKTQLAANGMLWVSWAKKRSPRYLDLSETEVREIGLAAGLVDVKVCAVDADWSGLKLVYRLRDR